MFVFLFTPSGHLLTIEVSNSDTVAALRNKAAVRLGGSVPQLVFEDSILDDHRTLSSVGVREGSVIDIKVPAAASSSSTSAAAFVKSNGLSSNSMYGGGGGASSSSSSLSSPVSSVSPPSPALARLTRLTAENNNNTIAAPHFLSTTSASATYRTPSPARSSPYSSLSQEDDEGPSVFAGAGRFMASSLFNNNSSSSNNTTGSARDISPYRPRTSTSGSVSQQQQQSVALQVVPPLMHLIQFVTPLRVHHPLGAGRRMVMARDAPSLYVFDLDDTIARNSVIPPAVKQNLRQLRSSGARMAIASFNTSAVEVLRENGVELFFDVIVCGWCPVARKTEHIAKAIEPLGWEQTVDGPRLYFFDDVPENVMDVRAAFPLSYCVRVYSVDVLPMLVSHCMQLDSQRLSSSSSSSNNNNSSILGSSSPRSMSPLRSMSPSRQMMSSATPLSPGNNSSFLSAAATPPEPRSLLASFTKMTLDGGVSLDKPALMGRERYVLASP